jgi:hypothetical protein
MLGLVDVVANMIQGLRVTELDLSRQYRRLCTVQIFIGKCLGDGLYRVVMTLLLTALTEQQ